MIKRKKAAKKELSRRDFIRTTATGVGAAFLAGPGVKDSRAQDKSQIKLWDYDADVVVVGYGGAGVVAGGGDRCPGLHDQGVTTIPWGGHCHAGEPVCRNSLDHAPVRNPAA